MGEKKLLEEIYDEAVNGSEYMRNVESEANRQLEALLSVYKEKISENDYIKLREIVVGGVVIAERAAFIEGIRYGMRLFMEGCIGYSDNNAY